MKSMTAKVKENPAAYTVIAYLEKKLYDSPIDILILLFVIEVI